MEALGRRRAMVQREERGGRDEVRRGVDREGRPQPGRITSWSRAVIDGQKTLWPSPTRNVST